MSSPASPVSVSHDAETPQKALRFERMRIASESELAATSPLFDIPRPAFDISRDMA